MSIYHLAKPQFDGTAEIQLTPMELIDRLVILVPPQRMLRNRYHGVPALNSPLRSYIIALTEIQSNPDDSTMESINAPTEVEDFNESTEQSMAHCLWVMLIPRIFKAFPLICLQYGAEMQIIAFITETAANKVQSSNRSISLSNHQ